jgi:hypothetical protein
MKKLVAIVGVVVLLIGIAVLAYGFANPVTTQTTRTTSTMVSVVPQTSRSIDAGGIWSPGAVNLQQGEVVTGSFAVTDYASSAGPVFVYIQDEQQFRAWFGCSPCTSPSDGNYTASSTSQSFTWTVPQTGAYYFVVDALSYGKSASTTFKADGAIPTTVTDVTVSPNMPVLEAGVGLMVLGAIVLAAGIVMTESKRPS